MSLRIWAKKTISKNLKNLNTGFSVGKISKILSNATLKLKIIYPSGMLLEKLTFYLSSMWVLSHEALFIVSMKNLERLKRNKLIVLYIYDIYNIYLLNLCISNNNTTSGNNRNYKCSQQN